MRRVVLAVLASSLSGLTWSEPQSGDAGHAWIDRSNGYTNKLLSLELEHDPENGSRQGLAKFDERVSKPTLADEMALRHELETTLAQVDAARAQEHDKRVLQDLAILDQAFGLKFRQQDYSLQHEVPFLNGSEMVFSGVRSLLDDQVAAERRPAAVVRLRRYAGLESGYEPIAEILKTRALEQMAKPGVIYPAKSEIETELGRNANYVEEIANLFKKYNIQGWQPAYDKLQS